jgi:hypothetical protein
MNLLPPPPGFEEGKNRSCRFLQNVGNCRITIYLSFPDDAD